jgi:hypothetical protein
MAVHLHRRRRVPTSAPRPSWPRRAAGARDVVALHGHWGGIALGVGLALAVYERRREAGTPAEGVGRRVERR